MGLLHNQTPEFTPVYIAGMSTSRGCRDSILGDSERVERGRIAVCLEIVSDCLARTDNSDICTSETPKLHDLV